MVTGRLARGSNKKGYISVSRRDFVKADLVVFVVLLPFGHKYAAGLKVKARWQKHLRSEVTQLLRC